MFTEYHCHLLPGIDDGSENAETSLAMLDIMKEQGVERVIFTPHFYCHKEKSIDHFIKKRQAAFESVKEKSPIKEMLLGAEVALELGLSEVKDIEKLAIQGTKLILIEMPFRDYENWMLEEVYNISAEFDLKVILAHVHRYRSVYDKDIMKRMLCSDNILQINIEAFEGFRQKFIAKDIINSNMQFVFGSDAHNLSSRKPRWDLLKKKVSAEVIEASNKIFDKYSL